MSLRRKISKIKQLRSQGISWKTIVFRACVALVGHKKNFICLNFRIITLFFLVPFLLLKDFHIIKRCAYKAKKSRKSILIIETGVLGDCMLVTHAFKTLETWCVQNSFSLTIVCSETMALLLHDYAQITSVRYVTFLNRDHENSKEFKRLAKAIGKEKYEYAIRRDSHPFALKLSGLVFAQNMFFYSYDVNTRNFIERKISEHIFTEIRNIEKDVFIPNVWREILIRLGLQDYKSALSHISLPDNIEIFQRLPSQKYILLCPEASNSDRTIDISQVREIFSYLKQRFGYLVVISTDNRDLSYNSELELLAEETGGLAFLGTTTLPQYFQLISKTELLVSCDTGAVHVACALGKKVLCLKGWWDYEYFLPYNFDIQHNGDKLPKVLYSEPMPECAFCGSKGCYAQNENCRKRRENGKSLKCNFDISIGQVKNAVEELMEDKS